MNMTTPTSASNTSTSSKIANAAAAGSSPDDVTLDERLAMRKRPEGRAIGYHRWTDLTFLHWRLPADFVAPLLPAGLTLDTWEGDAWLGVVPFYMSGVRPWWSPPVPGISNFAESNVRTYVHHQGHGPGVWFFSLDAASSLAVTIARRRWNLNYFRARMSVTRDDKSIAYASDRLWPKPAGARTRIEVELADNAAATPPSGHTAEPGTLDFFLVERYVMYMQRADGRLRGGRVWHEPYPLRDVSLKRCEQTLTSSLGVQVEGAPHHVAYSPGVNVQIFAPYDLSE